MASELAPVSDKRDDHCCTRFCCSDFNRFQDTKLRHQANLTKEPVSLLAPERFPSHTDYSILRPSCQLASHLLASAPRFIVTMTDGDLYIAHNKDSNIRKGRKVTWSELDAQRNAENKPCLPHIARYPTAAHDALDDDYLQTRANRILNDLSSMVVFETHQTLPHGVRGMTQQLPGPLNPSQAKAFPRGVRSRIAISYSQYQTLCNLTVAAKTKSRPSQSLLILQFQLSKLLLHELGHALSNAVQGNTCYGELFHEDSDLAEMGYALETAVFGGVLDMNTTLCAANYDLCSNAQQYMKVCKGNLALHAWPDGKTQYYYERLGNKLFRSRRKLPPVTKVQRVELQFLAQLFSHEFWASRPQTEPLLLPTKGTWFDRTLSVSGKDDLHKSSSAAREVACELDDLSEGEYPKSELRHIVAQEIAAGTRRALPSSATLELPAPPLPVFKPLPVLPIAAAADIHSLDLLSGNETSYKLLTQDQSLATGELHSSIKTIPIAQLQTRRQQTDPQEKACRDEVGRALKRRPKMLAWLQDNLTR